MQNVQRANDVGTTAWRRNRWFYMWYVLCDYCIDLLEEGDEKKKVCAYLVHIITIATISNSSVWVWCCFFVCVHFLFAHYHPNSNEMTNIQLQVKFHTHRIHGLQVVECESVVFKPFKLTPDYYFFALEFACEKAYSDWLESSALLKPASRVFIDIKHNSCLICRSVQIIRFTLDAWCKHTPATWHANSNGLTHSIW